MELLEIVQLVIGLLFVATLVAIAVQKLRMPFTVGLVLVGLGLAVARIEFFPEFGEAINLRGLMVPHLILTILVPPLIFEAAFHIKFSDLKQNYKGILAFAIPGVLLTMLMVGGLVSSAIMTLVLLPTIYYLWKRRSINKEMKQNSNI